MAAVADAVGEGYVGARVDGEAVVLVGDVGAGDGDGGGGANVEGVGVGGGCGGVACCAGGVIDSDVGEGERRGAVNGDYLDGGVLEVETRDGGVN